MFKVGNIEINSKIVLAPMAGISSFGYRKFMSQFGLGYVVTEMISDMGLIYRNKETSSYLKFDRGDIPTCVQLFGSDPDNMAKAVKIAESLNPNIDFFDINMGCPVNKVIKTGAGSALMNNPKLCGDIVRAMKKVIDKPITVKIRLGVDSKHLTFKEVIKEVSKAGASLVCIHPRTTKELYSGKPHWDLVKNLRDEMDIPLLVSGNINTIEDALKAMEITHADGVMIARGGVGNPKLITNLNHYFKGEELEKTSLEEQEKLARELLLDLIEEKGEVVASRVARGIITKFFDGVPNSKILKSRLSTELTSLSDFDRLITEYKNDFLE